MAREDPIRRNMRDFKRSLKQSMADVKREVEHEAEASESGSSEHESSVVRVTNTVRDEGERGRKHRINVAARVNKAVAVNVGKKGATRGASSKQKVRIVQNGEETLEESETQRLTRDDDREP